MLEFPNQIEKLKDNLYHLVESVFNTDNRTTEESLFTIIQQLKRVDPDEYVSKLIEIITKLNLGESSKRKFIRIIRNS